MPLDGVNLAEVQTEPLREKLLEAVATGADGNLVAALVLVASVYEAMCISWARAARRSGGVNLPRQPPEFPGRFNHRRTAPSLCRTGHGSSS